MVKRHNRVRSKGRLVVSLLIILSILAVCTVVGFKLYISAAAAPMDPASTSYVNVNIPSGSSTNRIGVILSDNELVKDPSKFKLIVRLEGYEGKLKAGEYSLSKSMTTQEILEILALGGAAATKRFTIPEGYSIAKTADKLEDEGFINRETFLDEVENGEFSYKFMTELPDGPNRLEGFLFPETYEVYADATEDDIINRMLSQFDAVFIDEYYARANELGLSLHKIITIASLIESESKISFERPIVASVIYNRLSIGMPLQLDATVQYALGETKERLLYKDLEIDSPYNTYIIPALPPGPICSPGEEAIHAALYPDETDYIFYVLKPDKSGEHNFAKDINEFNRYKTQYINSL